METILKAFRRAFASSSAEERPRQKNQGKHLLPSWAGRNPESLNVPIILKYIECHVMCIYDIYVHTDHTVQKYCQLILVGILFIRTIYRFCCFIQTVVVWDFKISSINSKVRWDQEDSVTFSRRL